jgi:hypothetical protein
MKDGVEDPVILPVGTPSGLTSQASFRAGNRSYWYVLEVKFDLASTGHRLSPQEDLMTARSRFSRWPAFLLAGLALSACSGGDTAPATGLDSGQFAHLELEVAYPEAFSFLNSVREREDGTVMAADPLSQVLLRLDMVAGTADTLGRVGEGPEEYKQPDQVFPLPGDSTLLVDIGKVQLTTIDPEGGFHSGMQLANASDDGRFEIIMPEFLDTAGRIYFTASRGMDGPNDSTYISVYDRATGETEEVGATWRPEPIITRSGDNVRMSQIQMAGEDGWAIGPDGQFAVVKVEDYTVEWYYPDGRVVIGPPNSVESRTITDDDKYAHLEQRGADGLMMMVSLGGSGEMQTSMSRGGGRGREEEPDLTTEEWAEEFAPFRPDRSQVSPTGELWVERWLPAGQNPQMDIFDGEGVKLGTVELPPQRRLLGFGHTASGAQALYLLRTDEFDLKWLERYEISR